MNTSTAILALLALGGVGYLGYRLIETDGKLKPMEIHGPYALLAEQSKGHHYVVYIEAEGDKGFGPVIVSTKKDSATNSIEVATRVMKEVLNDLIQEVGRIKKGKYPTDTLRGITQQSVGIYDVGSARVVDKYEVNSPRPKKRSR